MIGEEKNLPKDIDDKQKTHFVYYQINEKAPQNYNFRKPPNSKRTLLTQLSRAGIPLRTIKEISGHAN